MPIPSVVRGDNSFQQLQFPSGTYFWPAASPVVGLEWMHAEVFEPYPANFHAYEWGGAAIRPGNVVLDAGACEGFFVRYALDRGATVVAIEPTPGVIEALQRTFANEIMNRAVEVFSGAVSDRIAAGKLRQRREGSHYENALATEGTDVSVTTIDALCADRQVDFIKMDIEGAEVAAIQGARETLKRWKPRLAIAVYHEVDNAAEVITSITTARNDYTTCHRGIFAWEGIAPRPMMVYAW